MMAFRGYGEVRYLLLCGKSPSFYQLYTVNCRLLRCRLTTRNVPGVAIYFYALSAIRTELSYIPYFQNLPPPSLSSSTEPNSRSALVKLSLQGNLIAGAIARTSVGFVLNPITVLKARYEVSYSFIRRICMWDNVC
jgi:hypothetical protein